MPSYAKSSASRVCCAQRRLNRCQDANGEALIREALTDTMISQIDVGTAQVVIAPGTVVRKAVHSVMALGLRQVLNVGMGGLGGILLARLLSPSEFGLFAIVTFVLAFLVTFGDAGLAASLVRQAHEPAEEDYQAVFTVQQVLVVSVVILFWVAAPWIARAYHLPPHDSWVFRLVALSLLCTSFQVIPVARLERHLSFEKLALVEVAMSFVFYSTAVGLAWKGVGTLSFAIAMVARSLAGALLANLASPWRIRWHWDWERARVHLKFGVPYQGIGFIFLLTSGITPVFIGLLLGAASVGYINWAQMVSGYPVVVLMAMQRVYLPAFARLQLHRETLSQFVEQVLRATNALAAPVAILTLVSIEPLTKFVFGQKWLPALPLFYLLWGTNLFVPTATPLFALLNALGYSRTAFKFALMVMLGTWALGGPLILAFGAIGFGIASLCVNTMHLVLYRVVRAHLSYRILPMVVPSWCVALVIGLATYFMMRSRPPTGLLGLGVYLALGLTAYALTMLRLHRSDVRKVWALVWSQA
jgi:O-antigen/teichoic acid export membrane protein